MTSWFHQSISMHRKRQEIVKTAWVATGRRHVNVRTFVCTPRHESPVGGRPALKHAGVVLHVHGSAPGWEPPKARQDDRLTWQLPGPGSRRTCKHTASAGLNTGSENKSCTKEEARRCHPCAL